MQKNFKNRQNPNICKHEWDYMIYSTEKGNIFIELCKKCFDTKGTIEKFV